MLLYYFSSTLTSYYGRTRILLLLILQLLIDKQHLVLSQQNFENGDVRLADGTTEYEGRVEVYYDGAWGTVCDDNWDFNDGVVVCTQLGFAQVAAVYSSAHFGHGADSVLLDEVACTGSETRISECSHDGWGTHDCSHTEDAGVRCTNDTDDLAEQGDVRLADGSTPYEGRVEVYYNGVWGTVCDDGWGSADGNVVCAQLGFGQASEVFHDAYFGEGTGNIVLDDVGCVGVETSIEQCYHNEWGAHNCQPAEAAGVRCNNYNGPPAAHPDGAVRLQDGSTPYEGRVEVNYNGIWGTVCDDEWDTTDGDVVCAQLGFGRATEVYNGAHFGQGVIIIGLDEVQCFGWEANLLECSHQGWGINNCRHNEDAGLRCTPSPVDGDIRLETRNVGNSQYEGRVEVYFDGAWGTVCDDEWDINDGDVVCAQLGFGPAFGVYGVAAFGEGVGEILLDNVGCQGGEARLIDCPHNGIRVDDCNHSEDASVRCYPAEQSRRLVFKAISGKHGPFLTDDPNPYNLYVTHGGHNEEVPNIQALNVIYPGHYKSADIDSWETLNVVQVDLVLYDEFGEELLQLEFNGRDSTQYDWMSEVRLLNSSSGYTDITDLYNYFSVPGDDELDRRFFINKNYNGCDGDTGWLVMVPGGDVNPWQPTPCDWEQSPGYKPAFMYSKLSTAANWNQITDVGLADIFAIYITVAADIGDADITGARYLGCFVDTEDRVFPYYLLEDDSLTTELCIDDCKTQGSRYAGTQYMFQCFCGRDNVDYYRHGQVSEAECNTPCSGDQSHICGGPWRLSVYELTPGDGDVRLMDQATSFEGRVEVYFGGEWGTVCGDYWDMPDAQVVCRQLGYGKPVEVFTIDSSFGSGLNVLLGLECSGAEETLAYCPHGGWVSASATRACFSSEARVRCEDPHSSAVNFSPWAIAGFVIGFLVFLTFCNHYWKTHKQRQRQQQQNNAASTPSVALNVTQPPASSNGAADLPPTYQVCLETSPIETPTAPPPHWEDNDVPTTPPPSYDNVLAANSEFSIPQDETLPPLYSASVPVTT